MFKDFLIMALLPLLIIMMLALTGCARVEGMGFKYSRWGDQNIEGFEFTQTLPDGTVNHVSFSKQRGGSALEKALDVAGSAIEKLP